MTAAMERRLDKLEQAGTSRWPRSPVPVKMELGDDDECDGVPEKPWAPGTLITKIRLVSLRASPGDPNYGRQFNTEAHPGGGDHA